MEKITSGDKVEDRMQHTNVKRITENGVGLACSYQDDSSCLLSSIVLLAHDMSYRIRAGQVKAEMKRRERTSRDTVYGILKKGEFWGIEEGGRGEGQDGFAHGHRGFGFGFGSWSGLFGFCTREEILTGLLVFLTVGAVTIATVFLWKKGNEVSESERRRLKPTSV